MKLPINIIAAGLGSMLIATPATADTNATTNEAFVTVTKVDFRGHPPFKRRTERLPVESVANFEAPVPEKSAEYVTVTTVDFKGRPPFKRTTETLPVEGVASFEADPLDNDGSKNMRFHGKPPYRR